MRLSPVALCLPLLLVAGLARPTVAAPNGLTKADRLAIQAAIVDGRDRQAVRRLDARLPDGGWCAAPIADTRRRAVRGAFHADLSLLARRTGRTTEAIECGYRALNRSGAPQVAAALYETARLIDGMTPDARRMMANIYETHLEGVDFGGQRGWEGCRHHVMPATWTVGCLLDRAGLEFDQTTARVLRIELLQMATRLAPRPIYARELAELSGKAPTWTTAHACGGARPHGICVVPSRVFPDRAAAEKVLRRFPPDPNGWEDGQRPRSIVRRSTLGQSATGTWRRLEVEKGPLLSMGACRETDIFEHLAYTEAETGRTWVFELGHIEPPPCGSGGWGDEESSHWSPFDGDAVGYTHEKGSLLSKVTVFEFYRTVSRALCQAGPDGVPVCLATSHTMRTMSGNDGLLEDAGDVEPPRGRYDRRASLGGAPRLGLEAGRLTVRPAPAGYLHPQFRDLAGLTVAEAAAMLPHIDARITAELNSL